MNIISWLVLGRGRTVIKVAFFAYVCGFSFAIGNIIARAIFQ